VTNIVIASDNVNEILAAFGKFGILPEKTDEVRQQVEARRQAVLQEQSRLAPELNQLSRLSPGEAGRLLEKAWQANAQSMRLSRLAKVLGDFAVSPQAMMVTEPVIFVFGGEDGERQPAVHIAKALKEKKIRINFRGTGSYSQIEAMLQRDPSFPAGPLKVVIPAGTCVSHGEGGLLEFPSFVVPQHELETDRVVRKD
jgi:hypothetical protein